VAEARVEPAARSTGPFPWQPGGSVAGWTVTGLLAERARREPQQVALREKWLGVYHEYTWSELAAQVADVALGLVELGLERGDRVAIMGDPCREYLFAELAVWAAGGISVGIYPTNAPGEVAYQLEDSGASIFIAEDQEHLDKLLAIRDRLPALKAVVVLDTRTLFLYDRSGIVSFENVQLAGAEEARSRPDALAQLAAAASPADDLCLIYTSGTTGPAKGVVHTHASFLYGTESLAFDELRRREERMVAHLPLAHVVGKIIAMTLPLVTRVVPHLPEDVETFTESIYEVAPTTAVQPPRFFEKFAARLLVGVDTSSWLKRRAYALAMRAARATVRRRWEGRRVPLPLALANRLARTLVFTPLLRQIGYHELRHAYTGSAPVPPEVATLWQAWGIDLRIIYGLTESGGIITAQVQPFSEPTDIGERLPHEGWELRIEPDGELLFKGPSVFREYWGKPEATAETVVDGWLLTGDVVAVDERGRIKLIDRKKDIVITSGGKSLSPQQIENELKASAYVSEAVVIAEGRKYVTALLELDELTVCEWARAQRLPYTSFIDLIGKDEVRALVGDEVERANGRLSRVEQVKAFRILPLELDPEQGDVTPTRKVKRRTLEATFRDLIGEMYSSQEAGAIEAQVRGLVS
jgi:long-chain acyl-CoA synthetase